jgi:ABC-type multidrug transport system fused ATPase/permease subunit
MLIELDPSGIDRGKLELNNLVHEKKDALSSSNHGGRFTAGRRAPPRTRSYTVGMANNEHAASQSVSHHRRGQAQRINDKGDEKQDQRGRNLTSLESLTHDQSSFLTKRRDFGSQYMLGLTIAGVASSLLTTIFGLFHVDVFLRAYKLPLVTYSVGNFVFSILNTANDLLGAWIVDSAATSMDRSDLIGVSGCIFAICFLAPFFRWIEPASTFWDGGHFVSSISLYDAMFSFTAILLGSVVTDNHTMSDKDRVTFMASGRIANLIASFLVARIGLALFDTENLRQFQGFILILALMAALMFMVAQTLTRYSVAAQWRKCKLRLNNTQKSSEGGSKTTQRLNLRRAVRDISGHGNFWAWIGMELLLESQVTFSRSFLKTFVDRLLFDEGMSREYCDWLLAVINTLGQICSILCYIPIRRFGYDKLYRFLFVMNFSMSLMMLLTQAHWSTNAITAFLVIYPTLTGAIQSAGFHLAMSDMVLEMKKMHALDGRHDEASLAGLFMGANALFCKPAESFLPILAAYLLRDLDIASESADDDVQRVLFKVLIFPPLLFSILQWLSWSGYTLTPESTKKMREDLHEYSEIFSKKARVFLRLEC